MVKGKEEFVRVVSYGGEERLLGWLSGGGSGG